MPQAEGENKISLKRNNSGELLRFYVIVKKESIVEGLV